MNILRSFHEHPWAALVSLVAIVVVSSPVLENLEETPFDDCPLSYYPMFSKRRSETKRLPYFIGIDKTGDRISIPIEFAGSGGFHQVRKQLNRYVRENKSNQICQFVAERISRTTVEPYSQIETVTLVVGRYHFATYFSGDKRPLEEQVLAACPVKEIGR